MADVSMATIYFWFRWALLVSELCRYSDLRDKIMCPFTIFKAAALKVDKGC